MIIKGVDQYGFSAKICWYNFRNGGTKVSSGTICFWSARPIGSELSRSPACASTAGTGGPGYPACVRTVAHTSRWPCWWILGSSFLLKQPFFWSVYPLNLTTCYPDEAGYRSSSPLTHQRLGGQVCVRWYI